MVLCEAQVSSFSSGWLPHTKIICFQVVEMDFIQIDYEYSILHNTHRLHFAHTTSVRIVRQQAVN